MITVFQVTGNSLAPEYQDGDFVVILKIPILRFIMSRRLASAGLKVGDIVAFRHPQIGLGIKSIDHFGPGPNDVFVVGRHPTSIDSRLWGPIPLDSLVGKVVWHIKQGR